ncbi:hypothetical protein DT075_23775 [Bacillus licheniformis]|nr:hypothetical protein DT075_23775 [Bacillus licheniformis]
MKKKPLFRTFMCAALIGSLLAPVAAGTAADVPSPPKASIVFLMEAAPSKALHLISLFSPECTDFPFFLSSGRTMNGEQVICKKNEFAN